MCKFNRCTFLVRQRTFHKDQVPAVLENLMNNDENGFQKAKEIYATLIELQLYKRKNECAELFVQYHLKRYIERCQLK